MVAIGRNRIAALVCAAMAVALFLITFRFEEMPASITQGFGAEIFPRLVLGVILVLCMLLALGPPGGSAPEVPLTPKVFVAGAALVGYMALLEVAGMLPAMVVFLFAAGRLWGERRNWLLLLTSSTVTVAIWLLFVKGFGIPLPLGRLAPLAGY